MKKIWVVDLSVRSQNLFRELEIHHEQMTEEDILNGIASKVEDLFENEM